MYMYIVGCSVERRKRLRAAGIRSINDHQLLKSSLNPPKCAVQLQHCTFGGVLKTLVTTSNTAASTAPGIDVSILIKDCQCCLLPALTYSTDPVPARRRLIVLHVTMSSHSNGTARYVEHNLRKPDLVSANLLVFTALRPNGRKNYPLCENDMFFSE